MVRGEGPWIFDEDGNRFVDLVLSYGPLILGHAHGRVTDAITSAAAAGTAFGAATDGEGRARPSSRAGCRRSSRDRISSSCHRDGILEILSPSAMAEPPSSNPAKHQRQRDERRWTDLGILLDRFPTGPLDNALRPAKGFGRMTSFVENGGRCRCRADGGGRIANSLEQRHLFRGKLGGLAHASVESMLK